MSYAENNLIDSDDNMFLTVNSLIEINSKIVGLNNITLREVKVKPCRSDKMLMDKDLKALSNNGFDSLFFDRNKQQNSRFK